MLMDSPYFQKTYTTAQCIQTETENSSIETQTNMIGNDFQLKLTKYENLLKAESTANSEISEQLQSL